MRTLSTLERTVCAKSFISNFLTSRERVLVAAFSLGFSQAQVARAFGISRPAVCQMTRRIQRKADRYWH
jgi:DNA-binding NarL/FixJ family response regulator